jgi:hypothetical protein
MHRIHEFNFVGVFFLVQNTLEVSSATAAASALKDIAGESEWKENVFLFVNV